MLFQILTDHNALPLKRGNHENILCLSLIHIFQTSIGQSKSLFTPLQLATYTATLANGGVRMKTHLVKSIKSYALDETVEDIEPEVVVEIG